jgi:hypothetical protein
VLQGAGGDDHVPRLHIARRGSGQTERNGTAWMEDVANELSSERCGDFANACNRKNYRRAVNRTLPER